ncbi:hypothetical protein [Lederbergia citrea]|uniref:Uncharacterized protein n=1 Tax=Lederbergia citrea TaxID=2833581 RepID=A0A942USA3_9BACI|nr:hypothetical protein [Lederbergia citrea]MBS4178386.1 hypothetical protein [Lederbergia citrea]MBS4205061.1 hypothetical protein [Lederbergia citrea]MBS4223084.1 hypothetical protein [Lederbergia citrea]
MDKNGKGKSRLSNEESEKVITYQELTDEITGSQNLKEMQPTPQPKDYDEIEY